MLKWQDINDYTLTAMGVFGIWFALIMVGSLITKQMYLPKCLTAVSFNDTMPAEGK
jgi:hypothetical protein